MPLVLLSDLDEIQLAPGIVTRIVHCDTMSIMHVRLTAGAILPEHHHVNEQVVNVIEGTLELTVAGRPYALTSGKVFVLPSDIPHSGRALTDCYVIDVFHPVREDLRRPQFDGYTGGKK